MSITTSPAPSHVSQRPPATLNENQPGVTPRRLPSRDAANSARIPPKALVVVAGFERGLRAAGVWSTTTTSRNRSAPSIRLQAPRSGSRCNWPTSTRTDQRRLAGTRHTGDGDELAERQLDVEIRQVVLARADDPQSPPRAARAARTSGEFAAQRLARLRLRVPCDDFDRSLREAAPAGLAGVGPEVDQVIGRAHDLERVLDHDDRVAVVANASQHAEQRRDVAGVQANRRLVEHVQRARQRAGQRGGELDALCLAAGERAQLATETDVTEADLVDRPDAVAQQCDQPLGALGFVGRQLARDVRGECAQLGDRELGQVRDRAPRDAHAQRIGFAAARPRNPGSGRSGGSARSARGPAPCSAAPRATRRSRARRTSRRHRPRRRRSRSRAPRPTGPATRRPSRCPRGGTRPAGRASCRAPSRSRRARSRRPRATASDRARRARGRARRCARTPGTSGTHRADC